MAFHVPEKYRVASGELGTTAKYGNNGLFLIKSLKLAHVLRVIASDGMGFEHVSVSLPRRCPTWNEMCVVKDLFWDEEDCCMQLHPPKSQYVNCHPHTLHIWRPIAGEIPRPHMAMV
jgi:hypothetical protein